VNGTVQVNLKEKEVRKDVCDLTDKYKIDKILQVPNMKLDSMLINPYPANVNRVS
jgi:hypothetical protein